MASRSQRVHVVTTSRRYKGRIYRTHRDPVAPAERSPAALHKTATHTLDDDTEVHSSQTLSTIMRRACRRKQSPDNEPTFTMITTANANQQRALDLLEAISV